MDTGKGSEQGRKLSLKAVAESCAQTFTLNLGDGSEERIWVRTQTQVERDCMRSALEEKRVEVQRRYTVGTTAHECYIWELRQKSEMELASDVAAQDYTLLQNRARTKLPRLIPPKQDGYRTEAERLKAEADHEKRSDEWLLSWKEATEKLVAEREDELCKLEKDKLVEMAAMAFFKAKVEEDLEPIAEAHIICDCVRLESDHSGPYFDLLEEVPDRGWVRTFLLMAIRVVDDVRPVDIKNSEGKSVLPSGLAVNIQEVTEESSTTDSPESASPKKKPRGGSKRSSTAS